MPSALALPSLALPSLASPPSTPADKPPANPSPAVSSLSAPPPSVPADGSPSVVYRGVVDGLYLGRYAPGQRLVEADLTRRFNVGRGSVREALNRLAAEGLVSMNLHRSAVVRSLSRKEARDIVNLLETLNGFAAKLAAQQVNNGASHRPLDQAYECLRDKETRNDFLRFARARSYFYKTIVSLGGNDELARLMPRTNVDLLRVQFRLHDDGDQRFASYKAIYDAVCEGEPRKAKMAAKTHMRRIGEAIAALPDNAFALEK